ncbi:MAG: cupin domain-containing protein [Candidatus Limiplasma sp.]|nr:cupin domain-containing protein [Candidatus Limiplasma sp.]MEA5146261.1 cupin domain-containing protein [Candidatus Limiplasma sp.]
MDSKVVRYEQMPTTDLGGGVTRKVLAWMPQQMMVEVRFEQGAMGAMHSHPHVQCTYVAEGVFDFTIEGEMHTVRAGDTIAFAPDAQHGCVCKQAGVLVDVFAPMREDFLS